MSKKFNATFLKYNNFLPLENVKGLFCYIIEHYGYDGLSVLYQKENDDIAINIGDWHGNTLDPKNFDDIDTKFMVDTLPNIVSLITIMGIGQCQLFFAKSDELVLTDLQLSLNKMAGPGFIDNIFKNTCNVQKIIKIETIDDNCIENIEKGTGSYKNDLILKPSRYRNFHDTDLDTYRPLYSEFKR